MGEVVRFPNHEPKQEVVRQCMCGNQFFWLHKDGRVECGRCHLFQTEVTGKWWICATPEVTCLAERQDGADGEDPEDVESRPHEGDSG